MGGLISAFLLWGLLPLLLALPCSPLFWGLSCFFEGPFLFGGLFSFFWGRGKGVGGLFSVFFLFWGGGGLFWPFYYNKRGGGAWALLLGSQLKPKQKKQGPKNRALKKGSSKKKVPEHPPPSPKY